MKLGPVYFCSLFCLPRCKHGKPFSHRDPSHWFPESVSAKSQQSSIQNHSWWCTRWQWEGSSSGLVEKEELRTTWLAPGHGAWSLGPAAPLPPLSWASPEMDAPYPSRPLQGPGQSIARTETGWEHWGVGPWASGPVLRRKGTCIVLCASLCSVCNAGSCTGRRHAPSHRGGRLSTSITIMPASGIKATRHRASYHHQSPHSVPPASVGLLVKREHTHADLPGEGLKRDRKTVTLVSFWPTSFNNARESCYFSNWKVVHIWLEVLRYLTY